MTDCDRLLRKLGACKEAREWAKGKTLAGAWAECERADWMLWLLVHTGCDDSTLRLIACDCAAHVLPIWAKRYPDDKRPQEAVRVARLYARGKAGSDRRGAARDAAWDAAGAAADAAAGAAADAASASAWGDAWDAADVAARSAADAASRSAASASAWDAAWDAERKWQEGAIRKRVPEVKP